MICKFATILHNWSRVLNTPVSTKFLGRENADDESGEQKPIMRYEIIGFVYSALFGLIGHVLVKKAIDISIIVILSIIAILIMEIFLAYFKSSAKNKSFRLIYTGMMILFLIYGLF